MDTPHIPSHSAEELRILDLRTKFTDCWKANLSERERLNRTYTGAERAHRVAALGKKALRLSNTWLKAKRAHEYAQELAAIHAQTAQHEAGKLWVVIFLGDSFKGNIQVGGTYQSKARAKGRADKLNLEYGGHMHSVREAVTHG